MAKVEFCIKARSPAASLPFKGQVTEQATVKWSIFGILLVSEIPVRSRSRQFSAASLISFPDLLWTKPKARSGQIRFALRDHLSGM